jgi:hypothetical protein
MKMKKLFYISVVAIGQLLGVPSANAAMVEHFNKIVSLVETDSYNGCIYFQLTNVTEANPVVPNGPWFAIDQSQPNAKELFALLLSSRLTDRAIPRVLTNGVTACSVARVTTIDF